MKNNIRTGVDWTNLWEAPANLLMVQCYMTTFAKGSPYKTAYGCFPENIFYPLKNGFITAYHSKSEISRSGEVGLAAHRNPEKIKEVVNRSASIIEEMIDYGRDLTRRNLSVCSDTELEKYLQDYYRMTTWSVAYYKCCNDEFQTEAAAKIEAFFRSKDHNANDLADHVYLVAMPRELGTLNKYELALNKLAQEICEGKDESYLKSEAKNISEKYGLIGTGEGGALWDENFVFAEAMKLSVSGVDSLKGLEVEKMTYPKRQEGKVSTLFSELEAPKEIQEIARQLGSLAHIKLESRVAWTYKDAGLRKLLNEISSRHNVSLKDLDLYTLEDFSALLLRGKPLSSASLNERKELVIITIVDGEPYFLQGSDATALMDREIRKSDHSGTSSFKGIVARKGVVTGKVTIVSPLEDQTKELEKVKEGDILVTGMTRPHMLPAMQKAAAFVTDEGGITCHAAIVAREMNKPCIVATRIATKVLKDGDMVEVDADTGIVRKIS